MKRNCDDYPKKVKTIVFQSKKITRAIEHQQDSFKGKWDNSGATEHSLTCQGQFNWIDPKTIARENDCRKKKIRKALEEGTTQQKDKGSKPS